MELILEVVSSERFVLGDNAIHRFLPAGGVIGRSSGCDWSIPDQTRHLSGRHAIISYEAGQFYITDISTNGIYLNGPEALPKNVAVPLQDEDRVMMGEHQFKVTVQVDARPSAPRPANRPQGPVAPPPLGQGAMLGASAGADPMAAVDAFIADRQQQEVAANQQQEWHRTSESMPDNVRPEQELFTPPKVMASPPAAKEALPPAGSLPDNWMDLSVVPALKPAVVPAEKNVEPLLPTVEGPATQFVAPVIPTPGVRQRPETHNAPAKVPSPPPPQNQALLAAFAEGLGVSTDDIARAGGEEFLKRAGALLRHCLQGLVTGAQARASLKNEFRLDMTLVNPKANNPIKFSAHGDQVVRHLLSRDTGSFLSVEEAVDECHEDFQQHQLAMMAGMQRAFLELIQQLSPDELEQRFDRLKSKGITFSSKGARYWDAYRELHQELQEEDDIFASMFAEPFARAYDEQIKKLKQNGKKKR